MMSDDPIKWDDPMKQESQKDLFTLTEQGSARFAHGGGEGGFYKYETGPTGFKWGSKGPPWSVEESMHFVCDEVGIDYNRFIEGIQDNKTDMEIAHEFNVSQKTIENLRERFFSVHAINGNTGQD